MPKPPKRFLDKHPKPKAKATPKPIVCMACGGTGVSSKGWRCVPCLGTGDPSSEKVSDYWKFNNDKLSGKIQ